MDKEAKLRMDLDAAYSRIAELECQVIALSKKVTDEAYYRAADLATIVTQRRQVEALRDELEDTKRELRSAQRWLETYRDADSMESYVRLQRKAKREAERKAAMLDGLC